MTHPKNQPKYNPPTRPCIADFNPPTEFEKYTLLIAAGNTDTSELEELLRSRPDAANWKVSDMSVTPLMTAAQEGNLAGIRLLVAAGAAIDAQDGHGKTAIRWAMKDESNYPAARLLKELGARLDIPDFWSATAENEYKRMTTIPVVKPIRLKGGKPSP